CGQNNSELLRCAWRPANSRPEFSVGGRRGCGCCIDHKKFLAEAARRRSRRDWTEHHARRNAAHDCWRLTERATAMVRSESYRGSLDDETISASGVFVRTHDAGDRVSAGNWPNEAGDHARTGARRVAVAR